MDDIFDFVTSLAKFFYQRQGTENKKYIHERIFLNILFSNFNNTKKGNGNKRFRSRVKGVPWEQ